LSLFSANNSSHKLSQVRVNGRHHSVSNLPVDASQKVIDTDAGLDVVDGSTVSDFHLVVVHSAPF
jgi:hypothetical protein